MKLATMPTKTVENAKTGMPTPTVPTGPAQKLPTLPKKKKAPFAKGAAGAMLKMGLVKS